MASILNADNGVVSGTSGLKYSSDNSGVIQLQTSGATTLTLDTSKNAVFANSANVTGVLNAGNTVVGTLAANATTITGNVSVTGTLTVNSTTSTFSNSLFIDSTSSNTFTFLSSNNNNNNVFGNNQTGYTNLFLKTDTGSAQIWRGGSTYTNYAGNSGLSIYCSNATGGHIGLFSGGDGTAAILAHANGNVTFPRQPMFSRTTNVANYMQNSPIPFNSSGSGAYGHATSHFNDSTYRFTAPITGRYLFLLTLYTRIDAGTDQYAYVRYRINGTNSSYVYHQRFGTTTARVDIPINSNRFFSLAAGDYVELVWLGTGNAYYYGGPAETWWEGFLVG